LIMRTAWLLKTEYEWAHHVPLSKEAGLTDDEIARIAKGSTAPGWSDDHRAVLQAVDELRRETFISDATWSTLKKYYNTQQLLELVYTSGGYSMTAVAINSLGIQVESGYPSLPRE
jgi:4-carboxymuconolactone decarboxylase